VRGELSPPPPLVPSVCSPFGADTVLILSYPVSRESYGHEQMMAPLAGSSMSGTFRSAIRTILWTAMKIEEGASARAPSLAPR
jgi:hypothetical protein